MKKLAFLTLLSLSWITAFAQEVVNGEIKKINITDKRITIKHEEIKSLDMPPMTMNYHVKNESVLNTLIEGQKIRFSVEKINGSYVVNIIN